MDIILKNCNNLDSAEISITESKLNIKYGANGTGKSTIARSIALGIQGESALAELLPFKLRAGNPKNLKPEVAGTEEVSTISVFDESYLANFTFRPDELVANSFDIFVKSPVYREKIQKIEQITATLKGAFSDNQDLETLLGDLRLLSAKFKLTKTGLSKTSNIVKSLGSGNPLIHIPEGLEQYVSYLRHDDNVSWIGWHQNGQQFLDIADNCPFCAEPATATQEHIRRIGSEFDKATIKQLNEIVEVVDKLGKYFSDDCRMRLSEITHLSDAFTPEQEEFLVGVKKQIDFLIEKLERMKTLRVADLGDSEMVTLALKSYRIEFVFLDRLESDETKRVVDVLNSHLDEVLDHATILQKEIAELRNETRRLIEENQSEINDFLKNAGYRYEVCIVGTDEDYRLRLRHCDFDEELDGGRQHLSFGERNAFALVLFMYECISKNPDLIILDDPISSFDKDKKFAILEMLFARDRSFKGRTVLMLTHDIEPVIDTVRTLYGMFKNIVTASFLRTWNGVLEEKPIKRKHVRSFTQICKSIVSAGNIDRVIKLIYLRRYFEITDDYGDAYEVLSNLFKKRVVPKDSRKRTEAVPDGPDMSAADLANGLAEIGSFIGQASYADLVASFSDAASLLELYSSTANGYEKLQLYRLIDGDHKNNVIRKYINSAYHIENDFICQLDPMRFDAIPQFVIVECDNAISELKQTAV